MHSGAQIGHYELLAVIGRGGMGEVWKAVDTRLRREVAVKTLPPELVADAARIARLGREATLLATLNHPNIAAIYGLEEHDGRQFLVLELVDGQTLDQRLSGGRLELDQAIEIALQIADALEAAHERGIIHRDLKPANVKITSDRRVKVLDFGIAKSLAPLMSGLLPTATSLDTAAGAVMGTPWYMSPEQARAEEAGRQTDIWSFGVVLYQMLTGKLPFPGNTATEALARVLETSPDLSVLRSDIPHGVKRLLRRCLEKDPRRRIQHAGDLRIEIEDALSEHSTPSGSGAPPRRRGAWLAAAALAAGAVAMGGLTAWWVTNRGAARVPAAPIHVSLPFDGRPAAPVGTRHVAIARDGSSIAYSSTDGLRVRALRRAEQVAWDLVGTNPFFSPDGAWVGFFSVDASLMKVRATGGAPVLVARNSERAAGATWATDGSILFATTAGLFRVSENGGEATLITRPQPERRERLYAWPDLLPGEHAVLLTVFPQDLAAAPQVVNLDLRTGESRVVWTGGSAARYVPTGHLVYAVGEELHAVRFDPVSGETRGVAARLPDIAVATTSDNGAAEFALATNGTLVSIAPRPIQAARAQELVWVDRSGTQTPFPLEPGAYQYPRVSPDGARVALDLFSGGNRDIWIWDLRRSSLTRLTSSPTEDLLPRWSNDGRRVFFASNRSGSIDVYSQAADGASEARVEIAAPGFQAPNSFTPDGTQLIVYENFHDISVLDLGSATLRPLLHNEVEHRISEISPDGRWLAYESNESGALFEIFLRPFPDVSTRREQVSIDGGRYPQWGPPGSNELYYVNPRGEMMSAAIELTPELRLGAVTKLFDWLPPPPQVTGRPYDYSPVDGRFLMTRPVLPDGQELTQVSIVLNWFDELRVHVP